MKLEDPVADPALHVVQGQKLGSSIMSNQNPRVVILNGYANGAVLTENNFRLDTKPLRPLSEGDVFLQTLVFSPDPYMCGRMTGIDNFYMPHCRLGSLSQALAWCASLTAEMAGTDLCTA